MTLHLPPSKDLGLRHVMEAGLAVIRNEQIDEVRRAEILDRLIEIFSEAERGSQAVESENLLFATEQRSDFERFSLFFSYLDMQFGANLATRLAETKEALGELRNHDARDEARLQQAGDLIENLIAAIKRDATLAPLEPPRTFQFG